MRPFVYFGRPGLNRLLPLIATLETHNAAGGENTHHLVVRNLAEVLGDDEVHQVIDVRKPLAVEGIDRDLPAAAF